MRLSAVGRAYTVLLLATIASKALGVVSAALMSRTLGVAGLGIFGAAVTLLAYALIITNWGLDTIGTREAAAAPSHSSVLRSRIVRNRVFLALALCAAILLTGRVAGWNLYLTVPFSLVPFTLALRVDWILMAWSRERSVAIVTIAREIVYLALLASILPRFRSVTAAAWCLLVAEIAAAALTMAAARGIPREGPQVTPASSLNLFRVGWPLTLVGIMSLTYTKIDTPLIAHFRGAEQAGIYFASYTVIFGALSISAPLARAAFPEMSRMRGRDGAPMAHGMFLLSAVAALVGAVISLGIIALARPILGTLYGAPFVAGAFPLQVLAVSVPFTYASSVLLQGLIAEGRQGRLAIYCAIGAAVNVCLNLILIPRVGIIGAAISTVATEVTLLGLGTAAYARRPGGRLFLLRLLSTAAGFLTVAALLTGLSNLLYWFGALLLVCLIGLIALAVEGSARRRRASDATGGVTRKGALL